MTKRVEWAKQELGELLKEFQKAPKKVQLSVLRSWGQGKDYARSVREEMISIIEGDHPVVRDLPEKDRLYLRGWAVEYLTPDQRPSYRQRALRFIQDRLVGDDRDNPVVRKLKNDLEKKADEAVGLLEQLGTVRGERDTLQQRVAELEQEELDLSSRAPT